MVGIRNVSEFFSILGGFLRPKLAKDMHKMSFLDFCLCFKFVSVESVTPFSSLIYMLFSKCLSAFDDHYLDGQMPTAVLALHTNCLRKGAAFQAQLLQIQNTPSLCQKGRKSQEFKIPETLEEIQHIANSVEI